MSIPVTIHQKVFYFILFYFYFLDEIKPKTTNGYQIDLKNGCQIKKNKNYNGKMNSYVKELRE